jgi:4-hydroxy-tetrahydrodipicolinate reductase
MRESIQLVVFGAAGRMGQALRRIAGDTPDLNVVAGVGRATIGTGNSGTQLAQFSTELPADIQSDVLIDVSGAGGFDMALRLALQRNLAFVSGSTGLSDSQQTALQQASTSIAVLWAANFSLGVAALSWLAAKAATRLPGWDCEIIEAHHRHKIDAPSGTALMLGQHVAAARGEPSSDPNPDRAGARDAGIGYSVIRAGDIVGEHEVRFCGTGERIELIHRASDRDVFARGALAAARWLCGRSPGRYMMTDVLGFED